MRIVDYIIIGVLVIITAVIIYRKIAGKSKGCSCMEENCENCHVKKKK